MSANGESLQCNSGTVKKNSTETEKITGLKSNVDNIEDPMQNRSEESLKDLSTKNIIEAFFCTIDNQRKELQIIEENLSKTLQKLQISLREVLDDSGIVEKRLKEQIGQGMVLLREIRSTLAHQESRAKSMRLQLPNFSGSLPRTDPETRADGLNAVKTDGGGFTPMTTTDYEELDETSDEEIGGKKQMEMDFVETILKAAKIRQKMIGTESSYEKEQSS